MWLDLVSPCIGTSKYQADDYIIYHPSNRGSFSLGNFSTSNIRLVHGAVFVQFSSKNATIVGPRHIVDEISKKL
jgi:hypothetical protein